MSKIRQDYDNAVSMLYSQIDQSMQIDKREQTVEDMREYMNRLDLSYKNDEIDFKILHVSGTKGKGSTCAFTESIIRKVHGFHTGMFTSPHLLKVNERIRLDGLPINDKEFAEAYFHVRAKLESFKGDVGKVPLIPGYFRMLTLLALYIFTHHEFDDGQKIDVVILEVGIGGRYDSTNVYESCDGCGIAKLGLDHSNILGDTLEKIAWEKGGIIKPQISRFHPSKAFTVNCNSSNALSILRSCAADVNNQIDVVKVGLRIPGGWKLGLKGKHQIVNAELAISLAESVGGSIRCDDDDDDDDDKKSRLKLALEKTRWPGRCQLIKFPHHQNLRLYVDGAHTEESVACCLDWFSKTSRPLSKRVLIFFCGHERNPVPILKQVLHSKLETLPLFDEVFFCVPKWQRPSPLPMPTVKDMLRQAGYRRADFDYIDEVDSTKSPWQRRLLELWSFLEKDLPHTIATHEGESVSKIIDSLIQRAELESLDICACGSLYLAGSVLEAVKFEENSANGVLK